MAAAKARLRGEAEARRAALAPAARTAAAAALRDHVLATALIAPGAPVSGFWPMGSEIDPRPLMAALAARGHSLCLPVVVGRGLPLLFRRWRPGDALVPAGFGTSVPPPDAPESRPAALLVPLLAFDRRLQRLGYGGGYYDRTLAALRRQGPPIVALGVAFAIQEVDAVPTAPGDEALDAVATEVGVLHGTARDRNRAVP